MTTKQKFDVENPNVVVLSNGRYAYREKCPWEGKNGKELHAFKFCTAKAYQEQESRKSPNEEKATESQNEPPESP